MTVDPQVVFLIAFAKSPGIHHRNLNWGKTYELRTAVDLELGMVEKFYLKGPYGGQQVYFRFKPNEHTSPFFSETVECRTMAGLKGKIQARLRQKAKDAADELRKLAAIIDTALSRSRHRSV